jgi:hypothetical protein
VPESQKKTDVENRVEKKEILYTVDVFIQWCIHTIWYGKWYGVSQKK